MKAFMDWLSNWFAPTMQKLLKRPWLAAVSSSMQKIIPFILTGSVIFFYNVFRSYIPALPNLGVIADYSFGMLAVVTAFMIANQVMEKLRHPRYTVMAGLVSICVFMMFCKPDITDGILTVPFERFGPTGILIGIIAGLFVSAVFNFYTKLPILRNSSMPDFVAGWVHAIIPITISLALSMLLVVNLNVDVFSVVLIWFEPVAQFGQTLPGFILLILIPTIFMTMGISTWTFSAIQTPIFMAGIAANIVAVESGFMPTNIVTSETVYTAGLITMGGTGCTLALNLLMMFSKSRELKTMGRLCIAPSIFNINEPLVFGTPIVFNPLLMLPMWLNAITGPTIVWIFMKNGWMKIPAKMIQVGQIPAPFSSIMITEDIRALICYVLLFAVYFCTWLPFFKVYEKQRMQEEGQETEAVA